MSRYKDKLSRGFALLSALLVMGVLTLGVNAQPVDSGVTATIDNAFPNVSVDIDVSDLLLPGQEFVDIVRAEFGSARVDDGNVLTYTTGANVLDVFGEAVEGGFDRNNEAQVIFSRQDVANPLTREQAFATIEFVASVPTVPADSFPVPSLMPPVVTDWPFVDDDDNIVEPDIRWYYWQDDGILNDFLYLDALFSRNWRNVKDAYDAGLNLNQFGTSDLRFVGADDQTFMVVDSEGNDVSSLITATLDLPNNRIRIDHVQDLDAAGNPIPFENDDWIAWSEAMYSAQPFTFSYQVEDAGEVNLRDRGVAEAEFSFMRGGSVFKPKISRSVSNEDGEEVVLTEADLLVDPDDLPAGWEVVIDASVQQGAIPYPHYSYWDAAGVPDVTANITDIDENNTVTYEHQETTNPKSYFYLRARTYDGDPTAGGVLRGTTWVQVRIVLEPEDDEALAEQAIDLEYTTGPHAASDQILFTDVIVNDELIRQGVIQDGDGDPRTANYDFPIRVATRDEAPEAYEANPESVRRLDAVNPDVEDGHLYGEDAEIIVTAQGGVVELHAPNHFLYTAPRGFTGEDSFTYTITDGTFIDATTLTTASATITVIVAGPDEGDIFTGAGDPRPTFRDMVGTIEVIVEAGTASGAVDLFINGIYLDFDYTDPQLGEIVWNLDADQNADNALTGIMAFMAGDEPGVEYIEARAWDGQIWSELGHIIVNVKASDEGIDENERQPMIQLDRASPEVVQFPGSWVRIWVGRADVGSEQVTRHWHEWLPPVDTAAVGFPMTDDTFDFGDRGIFLGSGYYEVWMRVYNEAQEDYVGPWRLARSFTIEGGAPGMAQLVSPIGGAFAERDNGQVEFVWNSDEDANWYRLWIGRVIGDDHVSYFSQWFNSVIVGMVRRNVMIPADQDFRWNIRPWGPDGFGDWFVDADGNAYETFTTSEPVEDEIGDDNGDDDA